MYREGRAEGGYRCSAAPEGRCWNKATATTKDVHDQISNALSAEMPGAFERLSTAIECLRGVLGDDAPLQAKLEEQRKRVVDLNDIRERLADAVVSGKWSSGTTPSILIERLTINENEKVIAEAELQRLQSLKAMPSRIPTADDLRNLIDDASSCLAKMDRQAGALLRRLTSRVAAIPYQQFDSNKVVLRARFELDLLQLLPAHVLVYFEKEIVKRDVVPGEVEFLVNLFLPSAGPLHFATALAMSKDGETLNAIGKVLGVSKRTAHIAVQYGRNMQAAELTDAYRELTERPVAASRWRFIRRSANSPLI